MSANHISQIFLSAENFPEWEWALQPGMELLGGAGGGGGRGP